MGFATAAEAARRGADVVLVAGPTPVEPPSVAEVVRVRSAVDMRDAVVARAPQMDVVVVAAAIADYAPQSRAEQKLTKDAETVTVVLKKNPDILAELGKQRMMS